MSYATWWLEWATLPALLLDLAIWLGVVLYLRRRRGKSEGS